MCGMASAKALGWEWDWHVKETAKKQANAHGAEAQGRRLEWWVREPSPKREHLLHGQEQQGGQGQFQSAFPWTSPTKKDGWQPAPSALSWGDRKRGDRIYGNYRWKLELGLVIRNGQNKETFPGLGGISQASQYSLEGSRPSENPCLRTYIRGIPRDLFCHCGCKWQWRRLPWWPMMQDKVWFGPPRMMLTTQTISTSPFL